jgi:hypothetical protein
MSVNVNVPYKVTIAADGTVSVQTVTTQEYNLSAPHAVFAGNLRDAVLTAFHVKDEGSHANPILVVDMSDNDKSDFVGSLASQLKLAPMVDISSDNLKMYLVKWAKEQLTAELNANGISAAMEAGALDNLQITDFAGDISGGAEAMFDGISHLSPETRSLIATQIPNSKYMEAMDASGAVGEVMSGLLPLAAGDSITFQFIITQTYAVSETPVASTLKDNANAVNGSTLGVAPLIGHYSVENRVVNVVLKRAYPSAYLPIKGTALNTDLENKIAEIGSVGVTSLANDENDAHNNYDGAVETARKDYNAWVEAKARHDAHLASTKAKETQSTLYENAKTRMDAAVAAAAGVSSGPLYEAAQVAISASDKARIYLEELTVTDNSANILDISNGAQAAEFLDTSKASSAAVGTKFSEWMAAKDALEAAVAERDVLQAAYDWKLEQIAAAKEAADTDAILKNAQATYLGTVANAKRDLVTDASGLDWLEGVASGQLSDASGAVSSFSPSSPITPQEAAELLALQKTKAEKLAAYEAAKAAAAAGRSIANSATLKYNNAALALCNALLLTDNDGSLSLFGIVVGPADATGVTYNAFKLADI